MTVASHVAELVRKHQALDDVVDDVQRNPAACQFTLRNMKKERLRLKEAVARLQKSS